MKDSEVQKIKKEILGSDYELSFSFVGKDKIKSLNQIYRQKNEPTDILSFSLDKNAGEILICKEIAKLKSKDFALTEQNFQNYLLFLVIHGCLHLKGLDHSDKMDRYELAIYSRYRHRHL